MVAGGAAPAAAAPAAATSVVVRLANAVTEADVDDESEYNDIKEDMCALPCRGFRFDGMANWIQHADGSRVVQKQDGGVLQVWQGGGASKISGPLF